MDARDQILNSCLPVNAVKNNNVKDFDLDGIIICADIVISILFK